MGGRGYKESSMSTFGIRGKSQRPFSFDLSGTVSECRNLETAKDGQAKRTWRRVVKVAYEGGVAELAIDPKDERFYDPNRNEFRVVQGQEVQVYGFVHSDPKMGLTFVPECIEVIDAAAAAIKQLQNLGLSAADITKMLAASGKAV